MTSADTGTLAPLRVPVFRRIWTASLLSNFGQLILGVGAAWEMTRLTNSPGMVALVQTALMLPLMLVAVPAGAIADMFDRRKVAMAGLAFASASSAVLTVLAFLNLTTPWVLLGFCSLIGAGVALYSPAWGASVGEQVEPKHLPAAVALGTISYNLARSFGPAVGGLIVLALGAKAAFAINAAAYLPLFFAYLLWRRVLLPARLPPESLGRAIMSGARYALHAAPVRTVMARAFAFGFAGASVSALAPLIARDVLGGDASTYGLLLGASGVGAVAGALSVAKTRAALGAERAVTLLALGNGAVLIGIGLSSNLPLTCVLLVVQGATSMLTIAVLNVEVQLAAPRWVTARALSLFSSALTGGIAFGAVAWGIVAAQSNVGVAMTISGAALVLTALLGRLFPLPRTELAGVQPAELGSEPEVALALNLRSGPIAIEVDYRVATNAARDFYDAMRAMQRVRSRNGGYGWSLARDIGDAELWTERFGCPTWGDYLRMRDRFTQADRDAQAAVDAFLLPDTRPRVRRRLERPFGSVRWRADSPDLRHDDIGFNVP